MNIAKTSHLLNDVDSDKLIRLIYVSKITAQTRKNYKEVFTHIYEKSQQFNKPRYITGFLCNDNRHFVQCLEGRKSDVLELMERIYQDDRHKKVKVIIAKPIDRKFFRDWRMRSLSTDEKLWTEDSLAENKMQQFIPFNPSSWPKWFVEYFIESMQKFENLTHQEELQLPKYNSMRFFDSSSFSNGSRSELVYFYIYLSLMIAALSALSILF